MEGTINIRGVGPEERRTVDPETEYEAGFAIETRCRIGRAEKISLILKLCDSLRFGRLERLLLSLELVNDDKSTPPFWELRSKEVTLDLSGRRRADDRPADQG